MRASRWGERLFVFLFFYYLCTQFPKFVYMIITIARQCGCGAIHVGEILAEHYGIPLYTRKSLMDMAEEKGILQEMDDYVDNDDDELPYTKEDIVKALSVISPAQRMAFNLLCVEELPIAEAAGKMNCS